MKNPFAKKENSQRLPELELKKIPLDNIKFKVMLNILIAQANNYVKCDMLRPGRADSACYHIAKEISYLYEDELNRPTRGRKAKVVY